MRGLRQGTPLVALGLCLLALSNVPKAVRAQSEGAGDPWARLPGILAGIKAPVFPNRDFLITDFGARPLVVVKVTGDW